MKKILYILCLSFSFAGELEVDGDLTVTGEIQSTTIDSLLQVIADLQSQIALMQSADNKLETRVYEFDNIEINECCFDIDLNAITGMNINEAIIQILKVESISYGEYLYITDSLGNLSQTFEFNANGTLMTQNYIKPMLFDSSSDYMQYRIYTDNPIYVSIKFAITAQFPDSNIQLRKTGLQTKDKK